MFGFGRIVVVHEAPHSFLIRHGHVHPGTWITIIMRFMTDAKRSFNESYTMYLFGIALLDTARPEGGTTGGLHR